jgi:hypothetical protein
VLFEGKCPWSRIPTAQVPTTYISQPLVGASTIQITDMCIFADAVFRKCALHQFGFTMSFDNATFRNVCGAPYACGFIGVYRTDQMEFDDVGMDLGEPCSDFDRVMYEVDKCKITGPYARYYSDVLYKPGMGGHDTSIFANNWLQINIDAYIAWCCENGVASVGIIPWKLFSMVLIPVVKDPEFLQKCAPQVIEVVQRIRAKKNEQAGFQDEHYSGMSRNFVDQFAAELGARK